MHYKITEHYARGEEKFVATFNELNDARFFMIKKSSLIDEERKKVIYRLYDGSNLLNEINTENIATIRAQYAEGNGDFYNRDPFIFQVQIKRGSSLENQSLAQFNLKEDAHLFITAKLEGDDSIRDADLFFIFQSKVLISTLNKLANQQNKLIDIKDSNDGSAYTLSPLSTRPTPKGGPPDYWVKNEDDS